VSFHWDSNYKGKAIALSNNNCTATKTGESDYQTVLGTLAMSQGRHYWEIKVEKFVDEEDLFVGIARYIYQYM
jgi:tripartite motif-containing protein 9/67